MDALTTRGLQKVQPQAPVLVVRNLRVTQRGSNQPIFEPVSFELCRGECVALVGASGVGKSLTLRALLNLLPENLVATFDEYRIGDVNMLELNVRSWNSVRGRTVGLIQQDTGEALDPLQRVEDAVAESSRIHNRGSMRGGAPAKGRAPSGVTSLLRSAGFSDPERVRRKWPHELSGGMRQRVVIASALSADPHILLADEPTTALDARVQNHVMNTLSGVKSQGRALIFVSHDERLVEQIADNVVRVAPTSAPGARASGGDRGCDGDTVLSMPAVANGATETRQHTSRPVLAALDLSVRYPSGEGIQNVSFSLRVGATLGVLGESGAGKSTLARVLVGLTRPAFGEVSLNDEVWVNPSQGPPRARRWQVQWVPQSALASFPRGMSVEGILGEAIRTRADLRDERRPTRDEVRAEVLGLLTSVQLDAQIVKRSPRTLSGGQLQRVSIARALAMKPRVLVCDEAVSALDTDVRAEIVAMLNSVTERLGTSLVFISHDVNLIAEISDEVIVMQNGRVIDSGPTAAVFRTPSHSFTQELLDASGYSGEPSPETGPTG